MTLIIYLALSIIGILLIAVVFLLSFFLYGFVELLLNVSIGK